MKYTIVRILQEFESIEHCERLQQVKFEMNIKMGCPIICRFNRA
jgi:hypothetical protein